MKPKQDSSEIPIFLVVGASTGIGYGLINLLSKEGHEVIGTSRRKSKSEIVSQWNPIFPLPFRIRRRVKNRRAIVVITAGRLGSSNANPEFSLRKLMKPLAVNTFLPLLLVSRLSKVVSSESSFVVFSGGGVGGPNPQIEQPYYVISKACVVFALEILTKSFPEYPSVISIAPGEIKTGFGKSKHDIDRVTFKTQSMTDKRIWKIFQFLVFLKEENSRALRGRLVAVQRDSLNEDFIRTGFSLAPNYGFLRRGDPPELV